ncbi:MAG: group III truncated hemoglobin [Bacteroidetes bacterium]|jgi:hemoglobin|nr:group III truncated hemoglobin [Bacteroidota bacterium]MBS1980417.1 group III truncated hemoglobin [Bacteroidota bacterium]
MNQPLPDITDRESIITLVDRFYEKVRQDDLLSPVFSHVNWPTHLPVMYNFWSSMLLGDQSYQGNPFQKHIHLPIQTIHFNRWLLHFKNTVDEHFSGAMAAEAKMRAESIASLFRHRLKLA